MNKNFKVFQIHGLTGLLLVGIIMAGIFCGFILFPIWIIMIGWNSLISSVYNGGPAINYYQATLLWLFIVLCFYLLIKNSVSIKIHNADNLDEENITKIIEEESKNEN